MKDKTTLSLVIRLNEIMIEQDKLEMKNIALEKERDEIIYELWDRIPSLTDNPNLQPKAKIKRKG